MLRPYWESHSPCLETMTLCRKRASVLMAGSLGLDAQEVRGAVLHSFHPLAKQGTRVALFLRIDRTLRQNAEPQQVGQPLRIGEVIAVFEPFVLLASRIAQF